MRFAALIGMAASFANVTLCTLPMWEERAASGDADVGDSFRALRDAGCCVRTDLFDVLQRRTFDVVLFEFYDTAMKYLDRVRFEQPSARVVVDSVDLHYRRLSAKAALDGSATARREALNTKQDELRTYRRADSVIMVTPEDVAALRTAIPHLHTGLIPNIHNVPPLTEKRCGISPKLLFVGGFNHEPNIDAVRYFATDIWPRLSNRLYGLKVIVVGENPPDDIQRLDSPEFRVLGHVPDIQTTLNEADISIAPLRWGGGIKGKVGEAMANGLPVVTTPVGAEGFDMVSGVHAIVAHNPEEFAEGVLELARNAQLYKAVREAAYELVAQRFSDYSVQQQVKDYFLEVVRQPRKRLERTKWLEFSCRRLWRQHVSWRLRRT